MAAIRPPKSCRPRAACAILRFLANETGEEDKVEGRDFPRCLSCTAGGNLLPLSDFGSQGAPIHYKAWVCSNPDCGFNIKIRNGDVYLNEPIANGSTYSPRFR